MTRPRYPREAPPRDLAALVGAVAALVVFVVLSVAFGVIVGAVVAPDALTSPYLR